MNFFGSFSSGLFKTNFGVHGHFFIEAVKKSPGIKILSLLIRLSENFNNPIRGFDREDNIIQIVMFFA